MAFQESLVIGIDLGTSNSTVAFWHLDKSRVKVLKVGVNGKRSIPSAVHWKATDEPDTSPSLIGDDAIAAHDEGGCTIRCAKRVLGLDWNSPTSRAVRSSLPFEIVPHHNPDWMHVDEEGNLRLEDVEATTDGVGIEVTVADRRSIVSPPFIQSFIARQLKQSVEDYLQKSHRFNQMNRVPKTVLSAVVGVPAHFTSRQRAVTKLAFREAGFTHVTTLTESSAAAMAYGLLQHGEKTVLVFDMGGGTTDVTVMKISDDRYDTVAVCGNNALGGEDIDLLLFEWVQKQIGSMNDSLAIQTLRHNCTLAKEELSTSFSAEIRLPSGKSVTLKRSEFDQLLASFLRKARKVVFDALKEARLRQNDINEVILVGGTSHTPAIQQMLRDLFPSVPELCMSLNATTSVAEGLAIKGAFIGSVPTAQISQRLMTDVTAVDVGIGAEYDGAMVMDVIIPRQSRLPITVVREFECASLDQAGVTLDVYEGTSETLSENEFIERFNFYLTREEQQRRVVKVEFRMNEGGDFAVRLISDARESPSEFGRTEIFLAVLVALLAVLYVVVKIYIRPSEYSATIDLVDS